MVKSILFKLYRILSPDGSWLRELAYTRMWTALGVSEQLMSWIVWLKINSLMLPLEAITFPAYEDKTWQDYLPPHYTALCNSAALLSTLSAIRKLLLCGIGWLNNIHRLSVTVWKGDEILNNPNLHTSIKVHKATFWSSTTAAAGPLRIFITDLPVPKRD